MSDILISVDQAAAQLNLHPKTVLRYIHDGRLPATRVGKSYRIAQGKLDAFAGVAAGVAAAVVEARATCIVDVPGIAVESASRLANFLNAAAMTGDARSPAMHLQTAFDPARGTLKIVLVGVPSDVARLLEMVGLQLGRLP
ncbi:MAG: excisionase family DNA-binding protein [Bauldia sp.]|nr:excisionase family DNA-binding protein [Bauldia sp.]MCW5716396.1 excisionase family DNA-binding protein [Bauldia sp.]